MAQSANPAWLRVSEVQIRIWTAGEVAQPKSVKSKTNSEMGA